MNYVTFKIEEERDGEFVLYLINHSQELTSEQLRSKNIDEVVTKLKEEMRYRKHFMNALGNFAFALDQHDKTVKIK